MANRRIFYAVQQVGIKGDGVVGAFNALHGVQSVGMTTNFNLLPVFELGQISLYQNLDDVPDVQVTLSKFLDGYPLIFHQATVQAPAPTLVGRSTTTCVFGLSIFPDTNQSATGSDLSEVQCSGLFSSSLSYKVNSTDFCSEDVTLVGNNKVWANDPKYFNAPPLSFTGQFSGDDTPVGAGGVNRRQNILFATAVTGLDNNGMIADPDCTILPPEVFGISNNGVNIPDVSGNYSAHIQSITASVDLNRQALNELGHINPYYRYPNFPVEVSCDVEVIATSGDMISAVESGIYTTGTSCGAYLGNLKERTIRIATCEGTRVYLGLHNKLSNVSYNGGDTNGGNVTVTYSFKTYNDFTVMHSGDPNTNFAWSGRATYLVN